MNDKQRILKLQRREEKPSPKETELEVLKRESLQLRGTIREELQNDSNHFAKETCQLLKHHGSYQQDNRDLRNAKLPNGLSAGKFYRCMVRTRIPGGKVTAEQFLAQLDLCEKFGNGTLRITTRQAFQLHGVLKGNLRETIREINRHQLTTFAACGDVNRNVMCCPAPFAGNDVKAEMQALAYRIAEHFKPQTTAYHEIWLRDEQGEKWNVTEFQPVDEPIYGTQYLPRKFKMAIALPQDNCVDVYTQDLGLLAAVKEQKIVGYNVLVGGGMGMNPALKKTFPALGKPLAFVVPQEVIPLAEAVVKILRDYGNRKDRKNARLKYLIANWGMTKFRETVEEFYGNKLTHPEEIVITETLDHIGWQEQGDGRLYLGINVEHGRIRDDGSFQLKSGLREILTRFNAPARLTAMQSVILHDIEPIHRAEINRILSEHGIKQDHELTQVRRYAMACPALPTCGLAVTESERVLSRVLFRVEKSLAKLELNGEKISIHMTGCPNGCARPYTPDIGLVGKAQGKYTIYLGGSSLGTRLAFVFREMVPLNEIHEVLQPVFRLFRTARQESESFGDFCHRLGKDELARILSENIAMKKGNLAA